MWLRVPLCAEQCMVCFWSLLQPKAEFYVSAMVACLLSTGTSGMSHLQRGSVQSMCYNRPVGHSCLCCCWAVSPQFFFFPQFFHSWWAPLFLLPYFWAFFKQSPHGRCRGRPHPVTHSWGFGVLHRGVSAVGDVPSPLLSQEKRACRRKHLPDHKSHLNQHYECCESESNRKGKIHAELKLAVTLPKVEKLSRSITKSYLIKMVSFSSCAFHHCIFDMNNNRIIIVMLLLLRSNKNDDLHITSIWFS